MKPETVRRRMANMERRLQRDLDRLEAMYPKVDWEGSAIATEAIRNLATAIAYVASMQGLSDIGVERESEFHKSKVCNCCHPAPAEWQFCHCAEGPQVTNGHQGGEAT